MIFVQIYNNGLVREFSHLEYVLKDHIQSNNKDKVMIRKIDKNIQKKE